MPQKILPRSIHRRIASKSPLSAVIADRWFSDAYPPSLGITIKGGQDKYYNYIRNIAPNLHSEIVKKLSSSAVIAANLTGNSVTTILDAFLENTASIWDFSAQSNLFQDTTALSPVSADDQPVRLIKPFTGTNNFTLTATTTPARSNEKKGLKFLNDPTSEYRCNNVSAKTFIIVHHPVTYIDAKSTGQFYPFVLSQAGSDNSYDFHSGYATYFDSTWSIAYNQNLYLNGVAITGANLVPNFTRHMLTISTVNNTILSFNSISNDRDLLLGGNYDRHYAGDYKFLFVSNNVYSASLLAGLNALCKAYNKVI